MDVFIGTIQDILFKEDLSIVYFYKITGIFSNIKGCLSRESYPLKEDYHWFMSPELDELIPVIIEALLICEFLVYIRKLEEII